VLRTSGAKHTAEFRLEAESDYPDRLKAGLQQVSVRAVSPILEKLSRRQSTTLPMREIDATTAADYLRETGRVPTGTDIWVRELAGGVSNIVLRVDFVGRPPFVIKQCRERLRVAMEWRARLDRIWTESATLGVLGEILPEGTVPDVLFEDRANYLFAMTCAPDDAVTWKSHLMAGQIDPAIAVRLGTILGTIHAEAPQHPSLRGALVDTSLFDELRVDPYYRTTAGRHHDLAPRIHDLIAAMDLPAEKRTLVLGDFSPKNILVHAGGLILLDFECAHAGDPAFDLGFFLSHLILKAIHTSGNAYRDYDAFLELIESFWSAYLGRRAIGTNAEAELVTRANRHTAACCLARVDGKSPVEYLSPAEQAMAQSFAREALRVEPATWQRLLDILADTLEM
jgi:5-methylthioribose kinase